MRCLRAHRLITTALVLVSLPFSQWALAQYTCPQLSGAGGMHAGQPCDGMDADQPGLCHQHGRESAPTFEAAKLPTLSLPALLQVIELPPLRADELVLAVPPRASVEAQPPPDPRFLATRRLRI